MPDGNSDGRDPGDLTAERARADVTRIVREVLDHGECNLQPHAATGLEAAIDALRREPASAERDSLIRLATEMAHAIRSIETMLAQARNGDEEYGRLRVKLFELGKQWSGQSESDAYRPNES